MWPLARCQVGDRLLSLDVYAHLNDESCVNISNWSEHITVQDQLDMFTVKSVVISLWFFFECAFAWLTYIVIDFSIRRRISWIRARFLCPPGYGQQAKGNRPQARFCWWGGAIPGTQGHLQKSHHLHVYHWTWNREFTERGYSVGAVSNIFSSGKKTRWHMDLQTYGSS